MGIKTNRRLMIADELTHRIRSAFGHTPTDEQERAIQTAALFLSCQLSAANGQQPAQFGAERQAVMVLRGSAGTGKTTLAAAIVNALLQIKQKLVLMAPTGRAAKVFSLYAGHPAYTIHRRIYRQQTAGSLSAFRLNDNLYHDTFFFVDEASMIADASVSPDEGSTFGSGSLLDDLIHYVYSGQNCHLIFIGDSAQLPPVGEKDSPALQAEVLRNYGLIVTEISMNHVLRQASSSGILYNATRIRQAVTESARLRIRGFSDISVVTGDELIEALSSSYSRVGIDDTIVVTRSNKRANIYNQGIRRTILDREDELCRGDRLMVVKNNYNVNPRGVFNGDHCVVQRIRHIRELYGFRFADVTLSFPDYDDCELTVTTLLDTLTTEAPALSREQQEQLYNKVMEDYADLTLKTERLKRLKNDPYYNALQVKFAYAVTCHKAQGGQWAHVYIDQGYMTDEMLNSDYYHWLYTALTRATERVFLVNWPNTQIAD